jgi:hypothetical protein
LITSMTGAPMLSMLKAIALGLQIVGYEARKCKAKASNGA